MKRINLLPEEIRKRASLRRITLGLVAGGLAIAVGLGAVWVVRQGTLSEEEDNLVRAEARITKLQAEVGALNEVDLLDKRVAAKRNTVAQAMANDVGWSSLLFEMTKLVPQDSWITSLSANAASPEAGATAYGTLTFAAITFEFPGVAAWITRLHTTEKLQTIWVPNASRGVISQRDIVNFGSTAELTAETLSGRYQGAD